MRVAFHTLGCKVNHYETEAMREAFVSHGAFSVGEEEPADVYIINTCTVTNIADRKSRQYIRRVKRLNPDALIVVTGCYAQVEPEEVAGMPEVDLVVGNGQKSRICDLVLRLYSDKSLTHADGDDEGRDSSVSPELLPGDARIMVLSRDELTEYEDMGLVTSGEPGMTRAYVKIQEGCDRFCSYCLIPYARGPVRSRPLPEIVSEVGMLLDSGIREIVLTGINTALYGTEQGSEHSLEDLLEALDRIDMPDGDDFRIRLSSLEPTVVDKHNVERIIRFRRLCHHLHLSVQNGSDKVLKAMNRHYTRTEYLEIVRAIREYDPLYGITTDIIVGFPGENEEDFADTLEIVRAAEFGKVHVFRYSPRKGTAGAGLKNVVPGQVKNDRSDILEREAGEVSREFMKANFDKIHTVLAEEIRDGYITGYTDNYIKVYIPVRAVEEKAAAPERETDNPRLGSFCRVKLTQIFRDGCKAVLI